MALQACQLSSQVIITETNSTEQNEFLQTEPLLGTGDCFSHDGDALSF